MSLKKLQSVQLLHEIIVLSSHSDCYRTEIFILRSSHYRTENKDSSDETAGAVKTSDQIRDSED